MKVSRKVAGVEYAIRDIVTAARRIEKQGRKVDYLNIGDPVQFGFGPPQNVVEALIKAVNEGRNFYAPSEGLGELREAIAIKEKTKGLDVTAEGIIVTNGVSEALDMVISSIIEEGDEVLLAGPHYPPYASYVRLHGGVPVEFAVDSETARPDIADIRAKITRRTVAICIINPNNPTGAVLDASALEQIVNVANEHKLYIICDEIYDKIVFDGKFSGIGAVAGDAPVILLNGFSKSHLMSGWRVGYIAFNESPDLAKLRENLPKLARVRIACNMPFQYAALESLRGPQDYIIKFVSEIRRRRDYTIKRLKEMPGIRCQMPAGAFYAFPRIMDERFKSDEKFVYGLLEEGVLAVHGSGFGRKYGSGHFRVVFLPDIKTLESAMDKISHYISRSS